MKISNGCLIVNTKARYAEYAILNEFLKVKGDEVAIIPIFSTNYANEGMLIANKITHIKRARGVSLSLNFTIDEKCYLIPLILRTWMLSSGYAISDYAVAV